eukprot:5542430-Prymnesium_polylepis.1
MQGSPLQSAYRAPGTRAIVRRSTVGTGGSSSLHFALVFASPLLDHRRKPLALLDTSGEKEEVLGALRRSERKLHCVSASATARNLRSLLTDGVVVLHYCGHGLLRPGEGDPGSPGAPAVSADDAAAGGGGGSSDAFCL